VFNTDRVWDCGNLSLLFVLLLPLPLGSMASNIVGDSYKGACTLATGSCSLNAGIFSVESDTSPFSFVLTSFLERL